MEIDPKLIRYWSTLLESNTASRHTYVPTVVLASNNKNKIREFKEILDGYVDINLLTMAEVGFTDDVEETGETFEENAVIKAKAVHDYLASRGLDYLVIADDSGLCCEALDGAPGVYSARYSGGHGKDQENRDKLRAELQGKDRMAYFICVVVLYFGRDDYQAFEGRTYGKIIDDERGNDGFAYDSIFLSDELGKTFAEASPSEKNNVSHRRRAINRFADYLEKMKIRPAE